MSRKVLTLVLNDPSYESARTSTAFRLADVAIRRGWDLFAYEGAVALALRPQRQHANTTHTPDTSVPRAIEVFG